MQPWAVMGSSHRRTSWASPIYTCSRVLRIKPPVAYKDHALPRAHTRQIACPCGHSGVAPYPTPGVKKLNILLSFKFCVFLSKVESYSYLDNYNSHSIIQSRFHLVTATPGAPIHELKVCVSNTHMTAPPQNQHTFDDKTSHCDNCCQKWTCLSLIYYFYFM